MLTIKSKHTPLSSMFSTVKKSKQASQLNHVKSYDQIFIVQELQPSEIKILLNNDKSLKNFDKGNLTDRKQNKNKHSPFTEQKYSGYTSRSGKQELSQLLEQSVKKQNILIKKNLFDPFKYFGSSNQIQTIQQSTRHHQSRLQAMFSENNSPIATDHSASYTKKSPLMIKKKINFDLNQISNSILIEKLEKLGEQEKKMRQNSNSKSKQQHKQSLKNHIDKQNCMVNQIHSECIQNIHTNYKNSFGVPQNNVRSDSKQFTQNNEGSSMISGKKISIENRPGTNRSKQVNCSPKSYVKEAKQKYLKMNLNSMQKVRLKLKLTSSKN